MAEPKAVRAVRQFRPVDVEYVVLEGAVFPADHPVVLAQPDHFEPASSGATAKFAPSP